MFFLCLEITVLLYFSSFKSCGESSGNNDQGKDKGDTMYQINYYSISTLKENIGKVPYTETLQTSNIQLT